MDEHQFTTQPGRYGYRKGCRCAQCCEIQTRTSAEYCRRYRRKHPEKIKAQASKRTESGRGKIAACKYRKNHLEKARKASREWKRQADKEYLREIDRRWRKNNPDYRDRPNYQATQQRAQLKYRTSPKGRLKTNFLRSVRKRRQRNAPGFATAHQLKARWDFYGSLCYLCGGVATVMDHVIPLSRGGSNWPANLRPACTSCNSRKRNKLLREYLKHVDQQHG